MESIPAQSEIAFQATTSDPDYYFATKLISQVQRDLQKSNRRHLMIASRWLIAFEYLKTLEERLMMQDTPLQREKLFFEATTAVMLGLGRLLLHQLANADDKVALESLGLTFSDLSACVTELEDIERSSHREWSPGELNKLHVAFGAILNACLHLNRWAGHVRGRNAPMRAHPLSRPARIRPKSVGISGSHRSSNHSGRDADFYGSAPDLAGNAGRMTRLRQRRSGWNGGREFHRLP